MAIYFRNRITIKLIFGNGLLKFESSFYDIFSQESKSKLLDENLKKLFCLATSRDF